MSGHAAKDPGVEVTASLTPSLPCQFHPPHIFPTSPPAVLGLALSRRHWHGQEALTASTRIIMTLIAQPSLQLGWLYQQWNIVLLS